MLFLLSRAFGFRLLLCLVLLIRFRRFVAHDEKGSSCNPQSQRRVGRPRLLLGAGRDSTYIWLKTEYLIVLAPRELRFGKVYNLITAYAVDFPDKIRQLEVRYGRRKR